MIDEDLTVDTKNGKQALYKVAAESVLSKGYGFTAEEIGAIIDKKQTGKDLTAEEADKYSVFNDELMAHATEHLLGNEAFIDKLVAKDAPLARKIFDKLVDVCKTIGGKGASKTLRTAQKLYIKAAEQSGNTRFAKYFLSHAPELEEEESLDSESEVRYNRKVAKKTFYFQHENFPGKEPWREAHRLAIWWAKHDDVETGEQTLISMNDVWYVVEKFDDADNGYQVEERLTAAEYKSVRKEIDEYGRSGQIKSVQGVIDRYDLLDQSSGSSEGRGSSVDRLQSRHGRENQKVVRVDSSENQEREQAGGDGQGNRSSSSVHRQGQNVKFSLKDSTGATLTETQAEYFKDSKVRDKDGNLLVMYQGAAEEFYIFDRKKSKPSNLYGRGFYFTNSEDQARHYGNTRAYYLGVNNPVSTTNKTITRMQLRKFLNAVAENEDYSIENYGTYDVGEVLASVYQGKTDFAMLQDVSATAIGDLVEAVELFNEINGTSYDGIILDTEVVTFRSEQAKLITNKAPTRSSDIRFSKKLKDDAEYFVEDKYFQSLMSKWNTLKSGAYVKVGEIGAKNPLHQVGMPTGTLRYDVDKLRKNMADHEDYLTTDLLKLIPDIIADPIAISEYSEENTVSVFGEATVGAASPMMVGVTISKDRAGNDISKVRTYNARKDVGSLITDDTILYLNENKKRTQRWFQVHGIQVPLEGTKFGFIRSIAQKSENVKRKKSTAQLSLKSPNPGGATYQISDGQIKKMIANYTRSKTYSKKEADEAIHEILKDTLYAEDEQATLRGKSREEVVNMLWQGLNAAEPGKRGAVANKVADYVIEHAMLERVLDVGLQMDVELLRILRPYLRKLDR